MSLIYFLIGVLTYIVIVNTKYNDLVKDCNKSTLFVCCLIFWWMVIILLIMNKYKKDRR